MGKAKKIVGGIVVMIAIIVIVNIAFAAMQYNIHQQQDRSDAKLRVLDQAAIALDHGDQAKYDQLKAQADSMPDQ